MIIPSEIENGEKGENLIKAAGKVEKSILRAFARTRAKKYSLDIGKYLSKALIFASTNPQYDNRLFIEL